MGREKEKLSGLWCMHMENQFSPQFIPMQSHHPQPPRWHGVCPPTTCHAGMGFMFLQSSLMPPRTLGLGLGLLWVTPPRRCSSETRGQSRTSQKSWRNGGKNGVCFHSLSKQDLPRAEHLTCPFPWDQPSSAPLRPSVPGQSPTRALAGLVCQLGRACVGHGARYGAEPPRQPLFGCTLLCKALPPSIPPSLGLSRLAGGNLWGSAARKDSRAMRHKLTVLTTNTSSSTAEQRELSSFPALPQGSLWAGCSHPEGLGQPPLLKAKPVCSWSGPGEGPPKRGFSQPG